MESFSALLNLCFNLPADSPEADIVFIAVFGESYTLTVHDNTFLIQFAMVTVWMINFDQLTR